jgi:hypothetical protein
MKLQPITYRGQTVAIATPKRFFLADELRHPTASPTTSNPQRMIRNRAAYLGHGYRTVASATLVVPNGHRRLLAEQHIQRDTPAHRDQPTAGSLTL